MDPAAWEEEGLWMLAWSWWDSNLRKRVGVVVYHALAVVAGVLVIVAVVVGIRAVVERELLWSRVHRCRLFVVVARVFLPAARLNDDATSIVIVLV